jgi:Xaa-Pro dipeptidase
MTEKELAAELVTQLLKHGSEPELPFSPIVSGGPNSANPHASPTERKLQAGDLLVIDWGATVDGYISDLTRTFAVRQVQAEYEKIHKIVQEANAAGRAAGKPVSLRM